MPHCGRERRCAMTRAKIVANVRGLRRRLPPIPLPTSTIKVNSVGKVAHLHRRATAAVLGCQSTVASQCFMMKAVTSNCIKGSVHQDEGDGEAEQDRGAVKSPDASTATPIPQQEQCPPR